MKCIYFIAIYFFMLVSAQATSGQGSSNLKDNVANKQEKASNYKVSKRKSLKLPASNEEEEYSSFSNEELRLGVQKSLDEEEIQYLKAQCRYAFMSEKEIIINRCGVKEVSIKE